MSGLGRVVAARDGGEDAAGPPEVAAHDLEHALGDGQVAESAEHVVEVADEAEHGLWVALSGGAGSGSPGPSRRPGSRLPGLPGGAQRDAVDHL